MNAEELASTIEDILNDLRPEDLLYGRVKRTDSFERHGVLTTDDGLVVEMTDGSKFQVTVVKSA